MCALILLLLSAQPEQPYRYEAEAALALAAAKSPCSFCKTCTCQNCGCDAYHKGVPAKAAGATFHAGHNCPSCGFESQQTRIVKGFNRDGTHTHSCPKCGTSWSH